jgi:hypothetical protein
VTGYLKNEVSIAPLIKKLMRRKSAHGQPAENERARAETQILFPFSPIRADKCDAVRLTELYIWIR